jgi:hypothetical protein
LWKRRAKNQGQFSSGMPCPVSDTLKIHVAFCMLPCRLLLSMTSAGIESIALVIIAYCPLTVLHL